VHGNCPTCHHYHRSVTVNVSILDGGTNICDAFWEHCEQPWLAFGNRSLTRISLLSSETTEPEPPQAGFRSAIIKTMRSVVTEASLFTSKVIPEDSSAGTSWVEPLYRFPFWFLRCGYTTRDKKEWEVHSLSHFWGEGATFVFVLSTVRLDIPCEQ
jgi:hypothetical protein